MLKTNTSLSIVLTITFIAQKLFGAISWNWWLIFSPVLIEVTIIITIFYGGIFFSSCYDLFNKKEKYNYEKQ